MFGISWQPFSAEEEKRITDAIKKTELTTSGEVRVHVDKYCKSDPVFKAQNIFHHLKMDETKQRNGVLIYVAINEHKFAIIGDSGINEKVAEDFWESTKEQMLNYFKQGDLVGGICEGVNAAGLKLKSYFPYDPSEDENELSDDITYG